MAIENSLNLAQLGSCSEPVTPGSAGVTIYVSATTFGNAVARLQWSPDGEAWADVVPTIDFHATSPARINIEAPRLGYLRMKTVVADGTADAQSEVFITSGDQRRTSVAPREKLLAQVRPSGTSLTQLFAPTPGIPALISAIHVCNTSGAARTMQACIDDDGTTWSEVTAIYWDKSVDADDAFTINFHDDLNLEYPGSVAGQTDSANGLTFTVFGKEIL